MHVSKHSMWRFFCVYGIYGVGSKHDLSWNRPAERCDCRSFHFTSNYLDSVCRRYYQQHFPGLQSFWILLTRRPTLAYITFIFLDPSKYLHFKGTNLNLERKEKFGSFGCPPLVLKICLPRLSELFDTEIYEYLIKNPLEHHSEVII